jgi:hypothetical protein
MIADGRIKSNKGKEGIANGKYEFGSGFSFNREEHSALTWIQSGISCFLKKISQGK